MAVISKEMAQSLIDEHGLKTVNDVQEMLKEMFGPVLQKMLEAEMEEHLGYTKHDQSPKETSNRRNGSSKKTVRSGYGELELDIPRDRNCDFEPVLIPKNSKDISSIAERIIMMYGKGMSTRDMEEYLREMYGINASSSLISNIIDKILPEVKEWQNRMLESVYTIVYMDAIHYPVRSEGRVMNKAVYIAIGINVSGIKDILGIWVGEGAESSKYWLRVLNELRNRGIEDILITATDNLSGFSEAIKAVFPETEIQKCIIHQIRNSTKYLSYKDRKEFCNDLKGVYKATTEEAGLAALGEVDDKWGKKYPLSIKSWYSNWDELATFFKYPQEIRHIIYTTNIIESYNRKLRKVTKSKGSFPSDDSLLKLLYLITKDTTKKWTSPIRNWPTIISQFSVYFEERLKGKIF